MREGISAFDSGPEIPAATQKEYRLSKKQKTTISELEQPIENILDQLRPKIEKGEYGLIVGDDASGRLPTRIVEKVLKKIYQKRGFAAPQVYFFAGSTSLYAHSQDVRATKENLLYTQINAVKKLLGSGTERVLIVTDTVQRGTSVSLLLKALSQNGIRADVVTIGLHNLGRDDVKSKIEHEWGSQIAVGMIGTPDIYAGFNKHARTLHGVTKREQDIFSTPFKDKSKNPRRAQAHLNKAREAGFEMAERLAQKFEDKSK
jgi:hypothetical protein